MSDQEKEEVTATQTGSLAAPAAADDETDSESPEASPMQEENKPDEKEAQAEAPAAEKTPPKPKPKFADPAAGIDLTPDEDEKAADASDDKPIDVTPAKHEDPQEDNEEEQEFVIDNKKQDDKDGDDANKVEPDPAEERAKPLDLTPEPASPNAASTTTQPGGDDDDGGAAGKKDEEKKEQPAAVTSAANDDEGDEDDAPAAPVDCTEELAKINAAAVNATTTPTEGAVSKETLAAFDEQAKREQEAEEEDAAYANSITSPALRAIYEKRIAEGPMAKINRDAVANAKDEWDQANEEFEAELSNKEWQKQEQDADEEVVEITSPALKAIMQKRIAQEEERRRAAAAASAATQQQQSGGASSGAAAVNTIRWQLVQKHMLDDAELVAGPVEEDKSFCGSICPCIATRSIAERDLPLLMMMAKTALHPEKAHHNAVMRGLRVALHQLGGGRPEQALPSFPDIGFQSNNPANDLRGTGMLGVLQLYYLVQRHRALAADLWRDARSSTHQFHLSLASFNFTAMVVDELSSGLLNPYIDDAYYKAEAAYKKAQKAKETEEEDASANVAGDGGGGGADAGGFGDDEPSAAAASTPQRRHQRNGSASSGQDNKRQQQQQQQLSAWHKTRGVVILMFAHDLYSGVMRYFNALWRAAPSRTVADFPAIRVAIKRRLIEDPLALLYSSEPIVIPPAATAHTPGGARLPPKKGHRQASPPPKSHPNPHHGRAAAAAAAPAAASAGPRRRVDDVDDGFSSF